MGNFKSKQRNADEYNIWYPNEVGATTGMVWRQKLLEADYGTGGMWLALKRAPQSAAAARSVLHRQSSCTAVSGDQARPMALVVSAEAVVV